MRSSRSIVFGLVMPLAFILVTTIVFTNTSNLLSNQFFKVLGEGSQDVAVIISKQIQLTDKDVQDLKKMKYKDIVNHPVNKQLQDLDCLEIFKQSANCIYIVTFLQPEEVKYYVTEETKKYYRAEVGQPLNVMWLVDAYMGEKNTVQGKRKFEQYYSNDMERYSCIDAKEKKALKDKKVTYHICYDGREGKIITAFAPIWTKEGNYIGLLGIDLSISSLDAFKNKVFRYLLMLLIISNLTLVGILAMCYYKYKTLVNQRMYCDPLTKTYNRRFYNEMFIKELEKGQRLADFCVIMMLDIDYFKQINDTYGHVAGDNCLVGIASSITRSIMENRGMVIRFGGEEFLITFYIKNIKEADGIVEKILEEIRKLDLVGDKCIITSSLGGCIVPCEEIKGNRVQGFIKIADDNLYQAKNNGRDQYYITKCDELTCKKISDLI